MMEYASDLVLYSALVATGVPWLAAVINRSDWPPTAKWLTFAVVCVLAAAGTTYLEGNLRIERDAFVRSLLIIATLASAYYAMWKPAVREVEAATG